MNYLRITLKRTFSHNYFKGDTASITRKITMDDLTNFTKISGDTNPIHQSNNNSNEKAIVHGALLNSILSSVIGTKLPGHGTLVISQNLNFPKKCYVDDIVTFRVQLVENRKIIKVNFKCEVEEENKVVMYGDAKLIAKDLI